VAILNRSHVTSVTLTSEVLNTAMQYYSWQEIEKNKDGLVSSARTVGYWYACHMCWVAECCFGEIYG